MITSLASGKRNVFPHVATLIVALTTFASCGDPSVDENARDASNMESLEAGHDADAAARADGTGHLDRGRVDLSDAADVLTAVDGGAGDNVASDAAAGASADVATDGQAESAATGLDASTATDASNCAVAESPVAKAGAAVSAGFTGTDDAYSALYSVSCSALSDCVSSCVVAGGTNASCTSGSECVVGGLDNAKHCLPPTYWRNVARGTSESGDTSDAAEQTLVVINYQDALAFTHFNVTLPNDAVVVGIQFTVRKNADDGSAVDDAVRVLKDGAPIGTDHHQSSPWPQSLTYVTYGGSADTWGTTWRAEDIRASGFGLSVAARYTASAGNDRAHIDSVRATVFYRARCD